MSIIQDERFTVTCDISGERLLNNEILGLADAPGVLTPPPPTHKMYVDRLRTEILRFK